MLGPTWIGDAEAMAALRRATMTGVRWASIICEAAGRNVRPRGLDPKRAGRPKEAFAAVRLTSESRSLSPTFPTFLKACSPTLITRETLALPEFIHRCVFPEGTNHEP